MQNGSVVPKKMNNNDYRKLQQRELVFVGADSAIKDFKEDL